MLVTGCNTTYANKVTYSPTYSPRGVTGFTVQATAGAGVSWPTTKMVVIVEPSGRGLTCSLTAVPDSTHATLTCTTTASATQGPYTLYLRSAVSTCWSGPFSVCAQTNAQFCSSHGWNCGIQTGTDTCGGTRKGVNCGTCNSPPGQCWSSSGSCGLYGQCIYTFRPSGTSCNDGDACTTGDQCDGFGGCVGTPHPCIPTQCQATSVCNGTGGCTVTNKPSGASCEDGNACTVGDHCDGSGGCTPGAPVICTTPPNSQCYESTGVCSGGACAYTALANGTGCFDGDVCTGLDSCQNGTCTPGAPLCCAPRACNLGECGWVDNGCSGLQLCDNPRPCPPGLCGWYADDGCGGRHCATCTCVPENIMVTCGRLDLRCEGDGVQPPRLIGRGDDNCGTYGEYACGACTEAQRVFVAYADPAKVVTILAGLSVAANHAFLRVAEGLSRTEIEQLATDHGATIVGQFPEVWTYQLDLGTQTGTALLDKIGQLRADAQGRVAGVFPNALLTAQPQQACPAQSDIGDYQGPERCAWAQNEYNEALTLFERFRRRVPLTNVAVGVLDNGLALGSNRCSEFASIQMVDVGGAESYQGASSPGHGAAVTSVIAAADDGNAPNGIASRFLFDHLRIMVAGTADVNVEQQTSLYLKRADTLIRASSIVNVSQHTSWTLADAEAQYWADEERQWWTNTMMRYPHKLLVVAAPNLDIEIGYDSIHVPVGLNVPNAITVGGTTSCQTGAPTRRANSAYGFGVGIYAPAEQIQVVSEGGHANGACMTSSANGNSFAAPQVAAAAAVVKSILPSLSGGELRVWPIFGGCGWDDGYGALRLCMGGMIGEALVRLGDPVINAVLDPNGYGHAAEGIGTMLGATCDMGMRELAAGSDQLRSVPTRTSASAWEDTFGYLRSTDFWIEGQVSAGGGWYDSMHVSCPACTFELGSYPLGSSPVPEGTASAGYVNFNSSGDQILTCGSENGVLVIESCRIDARHEIYSVPKVVTLVGRFEAAGPCEDWYLNQSTRSFNGSFNTHLELDEEPVPAALATYLEENCENGTPSLHQP